MTMTLLASATFVPGVAGASGDDVLGDCANGALKPSYPLADYREALESVQADFGEYSDCEAEIRAARDRQLAGLTRRPSAPVSSANGTGGVPSPVTPSTGGGVFESTGAAGESAASPAPTTPQAPTASPIVDAALLALPVGGSGSGFGAEAVSSAGEGDDVPVVPAMLAFSVIAIGAARGLVAWNRRPEQVGPAADPA